MLLHDNTISEILGSRLLVFLVIEPYLANTEMNWIECAVLILTSRIAGNKITIICQLVGAWATPLCPKFGGVLDHP